MAKPGLSFAGFLYDDAGDAINGATINLYAKNATTTSLANTTTDSNGKWSISHTPASAEAGEYDVQITSGASKRRIKFDDAVQLASLDAEVLSVRGNEGAAAAYYMFADEGEDAGDRWKVNVADGGVMTFGNDINSQGTYVTHVTITPNSTVASSTVAVAGNTTVGGALTVTGATTLNGNVTLGDAASDVITVNGTLAGASALQFEGATADGYETTVAFVDPTADRTIYFPNQGGYLAVLASASTTQVSATPEELNVLDGVTAGTVSASLGVVVDSDKDIGSFRNVTLTGELDAATLDLSSSADIAGDLVLSGGADGALQFTNAGENSIKIPDNQGSALIIEEANNAYMTFVTTDSSEAVSIAKTLTLSTVAAAGTDTDKFLVLDSSGNVDYRTGSQVLSDIGAGTGGGDMTSFQLEDDDGTEVTISNAKEVKIIGSGVTTNWTDTDNGTDGDPYDLTITVDAAQTGITSVYNASLKVGRDADNLVDFATTDNKIILRVEGVDEVELVQNALSPVTSDGVALGTGSLMWSDLFLASASVINFNNGDVTLTHASNTVTLAGGNLALTDASVQLDSGPSDETVSGVTASFTAGEDLVRGEVVYYKPGDSKMWKAVATAAATSRCVAMAAADISADAAGVFLLKGFLQDNGSFPSYTAGDTLYTPEAETSSQNVPETAAPDTDGDFVQILGWAVSANTVYFDPDLTIIEVA